MESCKVYVDVTAEFTKESMNFMIITFIGKALNLMNLMEY